MTAGRSEFEIIAVDNNSEDGTAEYLTKQDAVRSILLKDNGGIAGYNKGFEQATGDSVLMADMNPLAERFPSDHSKPLEIRLDEDILHRNSINHGGDGQNVLFNDGSVRFMRGRLVGAKVLDDIFVLQSTTLGTLLNGCELPTCNSDAFLAP